MRCRLVRAKPVASGAGGRAERCLFSNAELLPKSRTSGALPATICTPVGTGPKVGITVSGGVARLRNALTKVGQHADFGLPAQDTPPAIVDIPCLAFVECLTVDTKTLKVAPDASLAIGGVARKARVTY